MIRQEAMHQMLYMQEQNDGTSTPRSRSSKRFWSVTRKKINRFTKNDRAGENYNIGSRSLTWKHNCKVRGYVLD